TVSLRNMATKQIVASTVTASSPINYPFLPYGSPGWYQFTGFCSGTYQVEYDASQTALNGVVPTTSLQGGGLSPAIDSNLNPDPINMAAIAVNPLVDETHDFGFVGVAPLTVTCPAGMGQVSSGYDSTANASGGISPYTFSITSGALPDGLTLNTA